MTRVLFDLRSGWGLGDVTQASILFRHLHKYRPQWLVDVRCSDGHASALHGHVNAVWPSNGPDPDSEYESVIALHWTDAFETFADRPSTKVCYALKHVFGIEQYDTDLGRYEIAVPDGVMAEYQRRAESLGRPHVVFHTEGSSHPAKKNLPKEFGGEVGAECVRIPAGWTWLGAEGGEVGEGADGLAAMIGAADAFIGIDSGPGKVASATSTPTLICWTQHHPLRYHDPAPNTTHLIPEEWHHMPPLDGEARAAYAARRYFEANYRFRTYRDGELASEACKWLRETLT